MGKTMIIALAALAAVATETAVTAVNAAPGNDAWTVKCMAGPAVQTWNEASGPLYNQGGFTFTSREGADVRTTAGMNCWAVKNRRPVS